MEKHHEESIRRVVEYFRQDPEVQALILGGSLAHGNAAPDSDIDLMIVVPDDRYEERVKQGCVHYMNVDMCPYKGGYVDGKYLGVGFLSKVAERGSEPARFAFQDARVLFSRVKGIEECVRAISRYPVEGKEERIRRFHAQFEGWYWFVTEAVRKSDPYLLGMAVSKMVLFGGRLILAHNELLYPFHKWFLRALDGAKEKPADLVPCIKGLYDEMSLENAQRFHEMVQTFREWAPGANWPGQFVADSEWNWLDGATPVDDL